MDQELKRKLHYEKRFRIALAVCATLIVVAIAFAIWPHGRDYDDATLNSFAQCLKSKQVTMYGTYWCSHCQNQKAMFGDAFQHVPYVECTRDVKLCADLGINVTPMWFFPDGTRYAGELKIKELGEKSGCVLPEKAK